MPSVRSLWSVWKYHSQLLWHIPLGNLRTQGNFVWILLQSGGGDVLLEPPSRGYPSGLGSLPVQTQMSHCHVLRHSSCFLLPFSEKGMLLFWEMHWIFLQMFLKEEDKGIIALSCRLTSQAHACLAINTWIGARWCCEIESWYLNRW